MLLWDIGVIKCVVDREGRPALVNEDYLEKRKARQ